MQPVATNWISFCGRWLKFSIFSLNRTFQSIFCFRKVDKIIYIHHIIMFLSKKYENDTYFFLYFFLWYAHIYTLHHLYMTLLPKSILEDYYYLWPTHFLMKDKKNKQTGHIFDKIVFTLEIKWKRKKCVVAILYLSVSLINNICTQLCAINTNPELL